MEIYNRRIPRSKQKVLVESSYSTDLQFYIQYPAGNVSLEEFDELALERLKSKTLIYYLSMLWLGLCIATEN